MCFRRHVWRVAMLCAAGAMGGCLALDEPRPIAPPGSDTPVRWLSLLGVFSDLRGQVPAEGFVPYLVNAPLYSDGASKRRFLYLPPGEKVHVTEDRWDLPVGAYLVKTFSFPVDERDPRASERLVETRFLVRRAGGYEMSTYLWNAEQTDAEASGGNVDVPVSWIDAAGVARSDHFHVPGTSQCGTCHAGRALGMRSAQMDRAGAFADGTANQIEHLVAVGLLDAVPPIRMPLPDPFGDAPLASRARSYLDANCGHCHGDGGEAHSTGVLWDLPHTGDGMLPICRHTDSVDGRAWVLVPGHPERSELIARMWSRDPFVRMPRGPTHVPDGAGIAVLSDWIASMTARGCP